MLVLGSSSTYSQHINHSGQDSAKFSFELHYLGPDLRLRLSNKNSITNPVSTKCRLQTGFKMQTRYKMQTENLHCFFVWYVITTRHFTTYRASRNRFSAIIFYDYLHCCRLSGLPGLPGRETLSAGVTICHVNVSRWGNPPSRGRIHGKKLKSETCMF